MKQFLFSFLFLTMLGLSVNAQSVEINEANFPNETFRTDVANMFDSDQDGWLSENEIANAKEINYGLGAPADVEGIRYFTSLETLLLNQAPSLTTLDIHGMTSLKILVLGGLPSLESINAAGCTALEDVRAQYDLGSLCSVDFSNCPSLRRLLLRETGFTSFDASEYENLTELDVDGPYQIGGQLTSLDVSHNLKLKVLRCSNNQLATLNVSANTELEQFSCSSNKLTALDLSTNSKLTALTCEDNMLTALDLSDNAELKGLWCSRNQLTTLNVSGSSKLENLECDNNRLTTLLLPPDNALYTFGCYNNCLDKAMMDNIISRLPNVSTREFEVIDETSGTEGNICTYNQVAAAKTKGWFAKCYRDGTWTDYEGSSQTGDVAYSENDVNTIEDVNPANVTMTRTIKEGYNTVVLPFDITIVQMEAAFGTGAEVYTFSENSDSENSVALNFTKNNAGTISANVPVLVKATKASTEQTFNGVQVVAPTSTVQVAGTYVDYVGVYSTTNLAAGDFFLATQKGEQKIFQSQAIEGKEDKVKPFRAYFQKKVAGNVKAALFIDGVATSISEINGEAATVNGAIYNLAGQRVNKVQKGIFIVNGKKVILK